MIRTMLFPCKAPERTIKAGEVHEFAPREKGQEDVRRCSISHSEGIPGELSLPDFRVPSSSGPTDSCP